MKAVVVFAALAGATTATDLSLTWTDCGDSSTHTKITGFTPSKITLGQKTTLTGTGELDEAVSGASFDLVMDGAIGQLLHCTGDASVSKTCSLPLGTGSLTFEPMKFPLAKGSTAVSVDLSLGASLPSSLAKTTTTVKATGSNGDKLFCLQIKSAPGAKEGGAGVISSPLNCKSIPYDFCCGVGTPCDCSKGTTAPGQCKPESWLYCCNVGTPCDCSQPPISANNTKIMPVVV